MRSGSRPAPDHLWHRLAAVLGVIFGIGPAVPASLFPQIAGLNQLGVVVLGAFLGRRTGMSPSIRFSAIVEFPSAPSYASQRLVRAPIAAFGDHEREGPRACGAVSRFASDRASSARSRQRVTSSTGGVIALIRDLIISPGSRLLRRRSAWFPINRKIHAWRAGGR
jgi:hypothetical protein